MSTTEYNPAEVENIIQESWKKNNSYKATPSKAKEKLNWSAKMKFSDLVSDMMREDLKLMKKEKYILEGGFNSLRSNDED